MNTRTALALVLLIAGGAVALSFALGRRSKAPELVWGQKGVQDGAVSRPRAAAIDPQGRLFLVDFTARIQAYDLDGQHLGVTFTTPDFRNGRPSGLGIDRDGNLLVADSHYHCVRVYSHDGVELKKLGGEAGKLPGQFGYISDCVQDAAGFYYISEFGQNDRITKLDLDGKFVTCFGESGQGPKQFARIRSLAFGPTGTCTSSMPATTGFRCSRPTASSSASSVGRDKGRGSFTCRTTWPSTAPGNSTWSSAATTACRN